MRRRSSAGAPPSPPLAPGERTPAGHPALDELTDWRLVGSGTTAEVWVAHQPSLRREVAVKSFYTPIRDEQARRRFENECHTLGEFSHHRGVVDVHLPGVDDHQRPFLMMRYYPRGSLDDVLAGGHVLPVHEVVAIGRQIAGALATLHAHHRQHRDVKPANILLSDTDEAVLADFGISGGATDLAASRTFAMTPLHAAPEMIRSGGASDQADVWSLASTLYTALLGRAPFLRTDPGEDSPIDLELRIMVDGLPPLDTRRVPADVTAVLTRGLARDPAERTQTAQAFDAELAVVEQAHGWGFSSPAAAPALPPATPRFEPSATSAAFGARSGELPTAPAQTPEEQPAGPSAPSEGSSAGAQAAPRFNAAMTSVDGASARDLPVSTAPDTPPTRHHNVKKTLLISSGVVLALLMGVSIYGAVIGPSDDAVPTTRPSPSPSVSGSVTPSGTSAPSAASVPGHVTAVARGTTVTVSWSGKPPDGAFGAVVSDGDHTWAATLSGHLTLTLVSPGKQACYSVSWLLDAKGTTRYSAPACVNGP